MIGLIVAVLLIIADQAVKFWAVKELQIFGSMEIIENFFSLTYVENTGAAFGFLEGAKWFFVVLTLVVVILAVVYYVKIYKDKSKWWIKTAIVMIGAGGIGNLIDRLFRGYVVDLFDFIIFGYDFPVFNVADILIVLGTALLMGGIIIFEGKNDTDKC